MKKWYALVSIAGDDMGLRREMSACAARRLNSEHRQLNSIFEWVPESELDRNLPVVKGS